MKCLFSLSTNVYVYLQLNVYDSVVNTYLQCCTENLVCMTISSMLLANAINFQQKNKTLLQDLIVQQDYTNLSTPA